MHFLSEAARTVLLSFSCGTGVPSAAFPLEHVEDDPLHQWYADVRPTAVVGNSIPPRLAHVKILDLCPAAGTLMHNDHEAAAHNILAQDHDMAAVHAGYCPPRNVGCRD